MKTKPRKAEFVYVTYINTTPRKLWRALTDPALIRQYWMGRTNTSTWRKGAPLESRSPAGELEWHGRIVENKPPHRLSYTFGGVDPKDTQTLVTFDVESLAKDSVHRGKGLRVTVTHRGYAPGSRDLKSISAGWPAILSGLKTLLETGRKLPVVYVGDCG